jgi:hypothetical protein
MVFSLLGGEGPASFYVSIAYNGHKNLVTTYIQHPEGALTQCH